MEKQAPRREPDVGLDPRTLGSRPEPKADAQLLSYPGDPLVFMKSHNIWQFAFGDILILSLLSTLFYLYPLFPLCSLPIYCLNLNTPMKRDFTDFIYSPKREGGRGPGRGRSRLLAGSPTWDSIQGFQDHALGQRQALSHWATGAAPVGQAS